MTNSQPGWEPAPDAGQPDSPSAPWGQQGQLQRTGMPQDVQFQPQPEIQHPVPVQRQAAFGQARKVALTGAEAFWYVLQCIWFGAGYFAKVPAKKALQDWGLVQMTTAEQFWYVVMCIPFGAGYFAKIPVTKALAEMHTQARHGQ